MSIPSSTLAIPESTCNTSSRLSPTLPAGQYNIWSAHHPTNECSMVTDGSCWTSSPWLTASKCWMWAKMILHINAIAVTHGSWRTRIRRRLCFLILTPAMARMGLLFLTWLNGWSITCRPKWGCNKTLTAMSGSVRQRLGRPNNASWANDTMGSDWCLAWRLTYTNTSMHWSTVDPFRHCLLFHFDPIHFWFVGCISIVPGWMLRLFLWGWVKTITWILVLITLILLLN